MPPAKGKIAAVGWSNSGRRLSFRPYGTRDRCYFMYDVEKLSWKSFVVFI
jgi:hypothetical protein